jgi:hypothetical protein
VGDSAGALIPAEISSVPSLVIFTRAQDAPPANAPFTDEDELRRFTTEHWEFFYTDATTQQPRNSYVQILWPKIEEYQRTWIKYRESDYWVAGKAMAADLSAAQITPPTWPRKKTLKPRKDDFNDDEIPF